MGMRATSGRQGERAAYAAAALAFASAAVSLYWALGGTALLDTVGGAIEDLARERSAAALALISVIVVAKLLGGLLALELARRRRLLGVAMIGGALLALYGGVLVAVGALVLTGVIDPATPVDEHALRWHVFLWDLWFLLWGAALAYAGWSLASRS
jgi:hypothetical protein